MDIKRGRINASMLEGGKWSAHEEINRTSF
jgi:hypothetical protein